MAYLIAGPILRRQAILRLETNVLAASNGRLSFIGDAMTREQYLNGDRRDPRDVGERGRLEKLKRVHVDNGGEL